MRCKIFYKRLQDQQLPNIWSGSVTGIENTVYQHSACLNHCPLLHRGEMLYSDFNWRMYYWCGLCHMGITASKKLYKKLVHCVWWPRRYLWLAVDFVTLLWICMMRCIMWLQRHSSSNERGITGNSCLHRPGTMTELLQTTINAHYYSFLKLMWIQPANIFIYVISFLLLFVSITASSTLIKILKNIAAHSSTKNRV